MVTYKKILFILLLLIPGWHFTAGQRSVVSAGGDITGTTGTISFSIGQVAYVPIEGESGLIYTGVQQPHTAPVVNTEDFLGDVCLQVYPNPFSKVFFIDFGEGMSDTEIGQLSLRLCGMDGRVLWHAGVSDRITPIDAGHTAEGVYILQVIHQHYKTSSIKLVKTK